MEASVLGGVHSQNMTPLLYFPLSLTSTFLPQVNTTSSSVSTEIMQIQTGNFSLNIYAETGQGSPLNTEVGPHEQVHLIDTSKHSDSERDASPLSAFEQGIKS